MSSFLGMNPYLEADHIWPSFLTMLASEIDKQLNKILSEHYYSMIVIGTVLEPITKLSEATQQAINHHAMLAEDSEATTLAAPIHRIALARNETRHRSVQIRLVENHQLVTSIEILSPPNKQIPGLSRYQQKRHTILYSAVHLIELDLFRGGQRVAWELNESPVDTDYVVLLNRSFSGEERISGIWPVAINEPLPLLPVPLLEPEPDILIDLNQMIQHIYHKSRYAQRLDYTKPIPSPKLRPTIQKWIENDWSQST
ncbi:MAG: DUF4058 family protein [Chloroflexota bacterium]